MDTSPMAPGGWTSRWNPSSSSAQELSPDGAGDQSEDIFCRRFSQGETQIDGEEGKRSAGFGGPSSSSWRRWRDRDAEAEMYTLIGGKISARPAERERGEEEKAKKRKAQAVCAGGRRRTLIFSPGEGGVLYVDVAARGSAKYRAQIFSARWIFLFFSFFPSPHARWICRLLKPRGRAAGLTCGALGRF